jgi:hypothetical protein
MVNKRKAFHLAAETMREIGILVAVFGPRDAFFQKEVAAPGALSVIISPALLAIVMGIIIEARD